MSPPVERLRLLAAQFCLGLTSPETVVERAGELLVHLPRNEALVDLAVAPPSRDDVHGLLERVLDEERSTFPDATTAGRLVARQVADEIVRGDTAPIDGARLIWWEVVGQVPVLQGELGHFAGLASEWEDSPTYQAEYEDDIRRAAQDLSSS